MTNKNQSELNVNHQKLHDELEQLAIQAAEAQAQIAGEAAKHEFRIRFNYYLQQKMQEAAAQTYSEVLQEVQEFVNQFAEKASTRALNVESSTVKKIGEFTPDKPQFASFSASLQQQRNNQSNLALINDSELNSEADKLALSSLGLEPQSEEQEVETSEVAKHNNNGNGSFNGKQIEVILGSSNGHNGHNGNGKASI